MAHLVRGLLDGDGSIINMRSQLASGAGLRGGIGTSTRPGHHASRQLVYGKHDSIALLWWLYADRGAPCLIRKREIWDAYRYRHSLA